jgi:hypothetical protein
MAKNVRATHTDVDSETSTTAVLAANSNRTAVLIQNDSDTDIWIQFGTPAVLNKGIRLENVTVVGSSVLFSEQLGNLDKRAINAIDGTGGKNLLITEWST